MSGAPPPKPTAEGTLAATPLGHVLLHVANNRLSGTLTVWPDDGGSEDRIWFADGLPCGARFRKPAPSLRDGLLALFERKRAPYAFYAENLIEGVDGILREQPAPLEPLLATAIRTGACDHAIPSVLQRLGSGPMRVRASLDVRSYDLSAAENAAVDALRRGTLSTEAFIAAHASREIAQRVLYLLAITRKLDVGSRGDVASAAPPDASSSRPASRASGVAFPSAPGRPATQTDASTPPPSERNRRQRVDPPPPPPSELGGEDRKGWEEIVARANAIENEDYFTMLEVNRKASELDVRGAYFTLVKRWHPDRLPPALKPLSKWVDRIFGYLSEAKDTLSDEIKRGRYMQQLQGGGGTPAADREVHSVIQAATLAQKAEVLVRRREWPTALRTIDEAVELDPSETEHGALRSWVLFCMSTGDDAPVTEILGGLERALAANEKNERAHFFLGLVLKKYGRVKEAVAHFERAAALNPRNIDAAREVRLANMRTAPSTPPAADKAERPEKPEKKATSGLIARIFGGRTPPTPIDDKPPDDED